MTREGVAAGVRSVDIPGEMADALLARLSEALGRTIDRGQLSEGLLLREAQPPAEPQAPALDEEPEESDHWSDLRDKIKGRHHDLKVSTMTLHDDGGNEVETGCTVTVTRASQIADIAKIALEEGYGLMAIGSRTSAISIFDTNDRASLYNLNGFIGIQIDPGDGCGGGPMTLEGNPDGEIEESEDPRIYIDAEGNRFEILPRLDGKMEVLKSLNPAISHRVRCWAGLTPNVVNAELVFALGRGHTTGLDLTTSNQAQIGAAICTGSQGPTRQSAKKNVRGLKIIDKNGGIQDLGRQEAQRHIGLNGMAGVAAEVTLDIIQEPKNEFGLFIPIKGTQAEGFREKYPQIMAALAPFTETTTEVSSTGVRSIPKADKVLIKGIEIVTLEDLKTGKGKLHDTAAGRADGIIRQMDGSQIGAERCEAGIMINGVTDLDLDGAQNILLTALYPDEMGEDAVESDFAQTLQRLIESDLAYLSEAGTSIEAFGAMGEGADTMTTFKAIRESIPEGARDSKKLGFTTSTDVNCRVATKSCQEKQRAYERIWATYWDYIKDMRNAGFRVFVYGHALSGSQEEDSNGGGGIDPHIRVAWEYRREDGLPIRDMQKYAIQKYLYMKKRKEQLYRDLMTLNGQHGIVIEPGEKGAVTNSEYLRFLETEDPEAAEEIWQTLNEYGGILFGSRCKLKFHHHPPRLNEGLLQYFAEDPDVPGDAPLLQRLEKSILYWCQNSHRSPEGHKVMYETLRLIREWLDLDMTERVFYAESPEAAIHTAVMNLTDRRNTSLDLRGQEISEIESNVTTVIIDDPTKVDNERIAGKRKILVADGSEPIPAETRAKVDVIIYSAEAMGAGGEMGIIVTNTETVKHAREIERAGNNIGYAHSFVAMNDKTLETIETPRMQVIAEVGCLLAEKLDCERMSEGQQARLEEQASRRTLNPGPSQINPGIIDQAGAEPTEANPEEVIAKLKQYLGIPDDYEIFFGGSATKAMEQIAESLDVDGGVCLNKGAFAQRQKEVVEAFSRRQPNTSGRQPAIIKEVPIRWGTGEGSQMRTKASTVHGQIPPRHLQRMDQPREAVFITGHETATGVQVDTTELHKHLDPRFLRVVDGTSELGGVKRDFVDEHGDPVIDVYFGSVQKFLGLPAGLSVMAVSPRAMEAARAAEAGRSEEERARTYRTFTEMAREKAEGRYPNLRGIQQLGLSLDNLLAREFEGATGIDAVIAETSKKMAMVLEWAESNPHVELSVEDERDRSEVMVQITGVDINVKGVRQKLRNIGVDIGSGYGPYKSTHLRLYLTPNVSIEELNTILGQINEAVNSSILPDSALKPQWLDRDYTPEYREARAEAA